MTWTDEDIKRFERSYESSHEDEALRTRGQFLEAFPAKSLSTLGVDQYVIGLRAPTFCDYVEVKTRAWATIQGSTAIKFGIYFGKTNSDPKTQYRFSKKFGNDLSAAFINVRRNLVDLVGLGAQSTIDFSEIDRNPLSQLFKAKILSLYYPDRFMNICSSEHLENFAGFLKLDDVDSRSQIQNALVKMKLRDGRTHSWSNPKFMQFLYRTYLPEHLEKRVQLGKPRKTSHRRVDFEELQALWAEIGEAAETFAYNWEMERLAVANVRYPRIEDRRARPGYGYDFESYDALENARYIEVKAVGKIRGDKGFRFFLSENEKFVSEKNQSSGNYFFYLIFFGKDGKPESLRPFLASELYASAEIIPSSFTVRFSL